MTVHKGGKVGKAGSTLSKSKNKAEKTKAAKILNDHKNKKHSKK